MLKKERIELGTISSRGQVAIPSDIRQEMDLRDGTRVLFFLSDDTLLMKKVTTTSFLEITKPLKEAAKRAGLKESEVPRIIERVRKRKK